MLKEAESQFIENGYTVIKVDGLDKLVPSLINIYNQLILNAEKMGLDGLVKTRKSNLVEAEGYGWSWGCDHIFNPLLREQQLLDIVSLEPIPTLLKMILGEKIRFSGGHGHWSPKTYDYYLHWHRDTLRPLWTKANKDPRSHVQVCVALTDEAVVRIVPQSHLRNLREDEYQYITDNPHGKHPEEVCPVIPSGHALFLNTYTFHRAQCEKDKTRRCLHFGFTRVNAFDEEGRLGKKLEWMKEEDFINGQSSFLKKCIIEELIKWKEG